LKYLKILGLAAIVAAAFTALVGVGSASAASELCKEKVSPCPAASVYPAGTVLEATSTNATLTSSLGNVVCTHSLITGKTTTAGSTKTNVEGLIEKVSFTGCSLTTPFSGGTHACSVTAINLSWKAVLVKTVAPNGTLTVSSGGLGDPGAKVDCGANVLRCQFTSSAIALDVTGGAPATILAKEEPLTRTVYEGGLCPSSATWDANYTVIKPNPLYVS